MYKLSSGHLYDGREDLMFSLLCTLCSSCRCKIGVFSVSYMNYLELTSHTILHYSLVSGSNKKLFSIDVSIFTFLNQ